MDIRGISANNIKNLYYEADECSSLGIGGLSGSGKSTFCQNIYNESIHRIVTLLPKSEYRFLFADCLSTNYSAHAINDIPLVFYLKKHGFASNPRSTLGTHTGLFKRIRTSYAAAYKKSTEFFSFNNSLMWCPACKGRGSNAGKVCKECESRRYARGIEQYKLRIGYTSMSITELNELSIAKLLEHAADIGFSQTEIKLLDNLVRLGLPYLSLNRVMSTLSGGETIRVLLAEFMASCENSLIILDEISTGLDKESLLKVLNELSELAHNNTVWFIDHTDEVLYSNNKQLYFGPGSGNEGGQIVEKSPRPKPIIPQSSQIAAEEYLEFEKLYKRNICIDKLSIPLNRIVSVTGESGCGKSTLIHECIIPYMAKKYKNISLIVIGQDRNQSITSRSTISSFLDLKKALSKYAENTEHLELSKLEGLIKKDKKMYPTIKMLVDLGLGYLSLDRKVQTLSTGEFQCISLVEKLFTLGDKRAFIVLDEPSKGLSQNILNLFMHKIREIVNEYNASVLIIEHNSYIIGCSDYVFDFKKRSDKVSELKLETISEWKARQTDTMFDKCRIPNKQLSFKSGIMQLTDDADRCFDYYESLFKGGILKNFSSTAQWIYKDIDAEKIIPSIAIDLESNLYSKSTFLFELCSIINRLISKGKTDNYEKFDFYDSENLCKCCKGTGKTTVYDLTPMIRDKTKGLWEGLFTEGLMADLKRYNFTKIKFLFKEIKKATGMDLSKSYASMSEAERNCFLHGYWESSFYDTGKKTQRYWKGMYHLIAKYNSNAEFKRSISESKAQCVCPDCGGMILKQNTAIEFEGGYELGELLTKPVGEYMSLLGDIAALREICDIIGFDKPLNYDISELDMRTKVRLKLLELKYAGFSGFNIVLKNFEPFREGNEEIIAEISKKNRVILLDWDLISLTRAELLEGLPKKSKLKGESYVYEVFAYKKIATAVNAIKKKHTCPYCKGRGVLRENSIFENVDVTETKCTACGGHGISEEGMKEKVEGIELNTWLNGNVGMINKLIPQTMSDLPLMSRLKNLNKRQLNEIIKYLGEQK